MTRARNGAAQSAPAGLSWHSLSGDADTIGEPDPSCPRLADGDTVLGRVDGEPVELLVQRDRGLVFLRADDHERVEPDAVAALPLKRREKRSEADMRAAYDTIKVRLPKGYKARLQRLAEEDGYSVAEWVCAWVEMAETELAGLRQRPAKKSHG